MDHSSQFESRRKFPRRGYRKAVGILYQGRFWMAEGDEIGEGGIGLFTPQTLPKDAEVVLTIFIPGEEIAIVRSLIRYVEENDGRYRAGIQFTNFKFEYKKKVRDYIAAKSEAEANIDRTEERESLQL